MRVSIPEYLEKQLLNQYGNYEIDDAGHVFEYTEQDTYEQLRKNYILMKEKLYSLEQQQLTYNHESI